jgi:hypothetical protein
LKVKEQRPELAVAAGSRRWQSLWSAGDVFLRASAAWHGTLTAQFGDMVVFDELRRQCVERHGAEVADGPVWLGRHEQFDGVYFRVGTRSHLKEIDGFAFDRKRRRETKPAQPLQE